MSSEDLIKKIRAIKWDLRVKRPGFLQSKYIVSAALTRVVDLTPSVSVYDNNNIWVNAMNLYTQEIIDQLVYEKIPKAFEENKNWPLDIFQQLKQAEARKNDFVMLSENMDWSNAMVQDKNKYFNIYIDLLTSIQKYYVFTVPLASYCEKELQKNAKELLEFAVQYEQLDVDRMSESLLKIKEAMKNSDDVDALVLKHIKEFSWIKTNYNIVEPYTSKDVFQELEYDVHKFSRTDVPEGKYKYLVTALQVAIYLRNSIKEMSQQMWYAYDKFARQTAGSIGVTREDYLQLLPEEVLESLKVGKSVVGKSDLKERHTGFAIGVLGGANILITGSEISGLEKFLDYVGDESINEIKGNIASRGIVRGIVKVVPNVSEISKLNDGDILVTSMTTPDFIVGMKRAAAFVTDEGGLSCHAAIVAREMKKPCIIGTKIATKVLKDGDVVEVDAYNGIVKII